MSAPASAPGTEDMESRFRNVESALNAANEEIAELKTLVAFYEEKWAQISKK
jgi:endonuclease III